MHRHVIAGVTAAFLLVSLTSSSAAGQAASDLRETHELAVYATVRIVTPAGVGSGWLLAQSGRPLIVTNRHVAQTVRPDGRSQAAFYRGASNPEETVAVAPFHTSRDIDLGILRLLADPPDTARPIALRTDTTVHRGERVVLGGNPSAGAGVVLPFQTTEGVVTGHVSGSAYDQCGSGRNCIVVDAASFRGGSGGPAFNVEGRLVGMLWGGPIAEAGLTRSGILAVQNPTFSYLIHTASIVAELRRLERR